MIAGGLRAWLLTRGESISSGSSLTALVPMSVTEDDGEPTSLGSQVAPHLQGLPIGEPNPLMRLHQVAYATQAHKDTGRAVGARSLSDIAGFAPATLHALGVRVVGRGDAQAARPGDHQRARTAGAAVRGRGPAGRQLSGAAAVRRAPAGHRGDVLRRRGLLRADRRPGRDQRSRGAGPVPARRAGGAAGHHRAGAQRTPAHPEGVGRRRGGRRPRRPPRGRRLPGGRRKPVASKRTAES